MRIAALSDIHGNLLALEAVLAALPEHAPDLVVNLGDLVSAPLWPAETLQCLASLSHPTVRGNHDRWLAERTSDGLSATNQWVHDQLAADQLHALGALPASLRFPSGVLAVHGTPSSDMAYLLEDAESGRLARATPATVEGRLGDEDATLVLCGHSHVAQCVAVRDGSCVIVNPGSVGAPRSVDQEQHSVVEAGSPHARFAIITLRANRWEVALHARGYDWGTVAARARSLGRADWAAGFLGMPGGGA